MDEQKALQVMRTMVDGGQLTDPDSARGKLLQTAAHLFRNKGFERTTVRDLAGAVGIQSGSIFHHFKSKDDILRAVMEETIHYNTALMRASLEEAISLVEAVCSSLAADADRVWPAMSLPTLSIACIEATIWRLPLASWFMAVDISPIWPTTSPTCVCGSRRSLP